MYEIRLWYFEASLVLNARGALPFHMYLSELVIKNFRSCYETTVMFQESLSLLVGENNAGKSNVIQALQLVTAPLSGRTARYFGTSDVSFGRTGEAIELNAQFAGATDSQKGLYLPAIDLDTGLIHYSTRFQVDERGQVGNGEVGRDVVRQVCGECRDVCLDGRRVCLMANDSTVKAGSWGAAATVVWLSSTQPDGWLPLK